MTLVDSNKMSALNENAKNSYTVFSRPSLFLSYTEKNRVVYIYKSSTRDEKKQYYNDYS
jgi:hypothetical protein